MMVGMTKTKIAVSLPRELVDRVRLAVRRRAAPSVSAYVADAIEEKSKLDDLASLLDEMLAETGGPLSAAEKRVADEALGRRSSSPSRRRRTR
jgi:hypothetical protein